MARKKKDANTALEKTAHEGAGSADTDIVRAAETEDQPAEPNESIPPNAGEAENVEPNAHDPGDAPTPPDQAEGAQDPAAPPADVDQPEPLTSAAALRVGAACAAFFAGDAVAENFGQGSIFNAANDQVENAIAAADLYQWLAHHFQRGRVYRGEVLWNEARTRGHTCGTPWQDLPPARKLALRTFAYVAHGAWQQECDALAEPPTVPTRLVQAERDETMLETVTVAGELTEEGRALRQA